jgi:hypothetical protein
MAAPHSQLRRWAEVALTSLISALTVWDSFPDGTAKARIVRAAIAAALGPVLVYLRHGRGTRASSSPAPTGYARVGVLAAMALTSALLVPTWSCSSSSQSAGVLHETTSSSSDEHAASSADVTDHLEDHGQERIDENVVTTRSGGAIDLDVVTTKPDGTKIEKHLHRATRSR